MRGWYVIQTYTGYEKRVRDGLLAKKEVSELLRDVVIDARIPEEEYVVQRKNKKVVKKRKIYPGYVLVEMDIPDSEVEWKKVYSEIRSIPGFMMFLKHGSTEKLPAPLSYDEVKAIFEKTGEIKAELEVSSDYEIGEKVKIMEGAFKDFEGEIREINEEKKSLTVMVEIFGRLTPVELEFGHVRRV